MPTYHIHTVIDGRRKIAKLDAPSEAAARDQATRAGLIINAIELAPEPPQPASQPAPEPLITPASAPPHDAAIADLLARIHADLVVLKAHTAFLEPIARCELLRRPNFTLIATVCLGIFFGVVFLLVVAFFVLLTFNQVGRFTRTGG